MAKCKMMVENGGMMVELQWNDGGMMVNCGMMVEC